MALDYRWLWAGDSKKGSQDVWIAYDEDVCEKIEKAFNKGQKTLKMDAERFLDFEDKTAIVQRRYDDKTKRRGVKREDVKPKKTTKKRKAVSSEEEEEEEVKWFWAGDSKKGSQDVWIEYDASVAKKIESAFQKKNKKAKIDDERYIDLSDLKEMVQRRNDDDSKRRAVIRTPAAPGTTDDVDPPGAKKKAKKSHPAPSGGGAGGIEIVFSFDTTGSMMSALTEVRKKVTDIVKRLFNDLPGIRIGVMSHGDYCDKNAKLLKTCDLTDDMATIVNFIKHAPSTSGGDAPEAYEYVLEQAQELSWSSGAAKTLVVLGDAAPHPPAEVLSQMKSNKITRPRAIDWEVETDNLVGMGVKIHGVRCCSSTEKFYQTIADKSGGKCVNLDQFEVVTDMLLAMCFKEGGEHMLESYRLEVASLGRMDARMTKMFAELKEAV